MENGIILSRHTSRRLTAHQYAAAHRLRSTVLRDGVGKKR